MARKETITKDAIIQAAFSILQEEGIEQVTARKLAAKANCSTQPIFRFYKSMDEVTAELADRSCQFFQDYYDQFQRQTVTPFVNLGQAYIKFASEHKEIFKFIFLSPDRCKRSMYDILNGSKGNVSREIQSAAAQGSRNAGDLFTKMWIFIHGADVCRLRGTMICRIMRPCSFCGIPIILLNERETGGAMEWLLLKEKENREWNSRNMILLPE